MKANFLLLLPHLPDGRPFKISLKEYKDKLVSQFTEASYHASAGPIQDSDSTIAVTVVTGNPFSQLSPTSHFQTSLELGKIVYVKFAADPEKENRQ